MKPAIEARVHGEPATVDAVAWNALLARQPSPTPFMRHEYLAALHQSGSAVTPTGWAPRWLTLHRDDALLAGCALYAKSHSWGEYVFDWAWAHAYERHGVAYYPKFVAAVPFTPTPGTRLIAHDDAARVELIGAIAKLAHSSRVSSAHLLFVDDVDRAVLSQAGWLLREGVQFHWCNRSPQPYESFDAFLADLQRDKRKKIQQERRRTRDAGIRFTVHEGGAIDEPLWDFFYRCYTRTYLAHRSTPYLKRAFFADLAQTLPSMWVMFVARREDAPLAASLIAVDEERRHAWGRYWGSTEFVPCLHFEACYYQPLQWCIEHGYRRFEGGAQGEHKMSRGLLPVRTTSAHWLADARFASAVADFLDREGAGVDAYVDELREHNPFRA